MLKYDVGTRFSEGAFSSEASNFYNNPSGWIRIDLIKKFEMANSRNAAENI